MAAAALGVAAVATFVPAVRGRPDQHRPAPSPTSARPPRRSVRLIALSARLPVPLLLGLRLAARRPRRTWLAVFAVAVTISGIVAALATRAHRFEEAAPGVDPRIAMSQGLLVMTVMLTVQAVVNTICLAWATTLDTRQSAALVRAFGATPAQVSGGISAAQVLPALVGVVFGVAGGLGIAQVFDDDPLTVPPLWQLALVASRHRGGGCALHGRAGPDRRHPAGRRDPAGRLRLRPADHARVIGRTGLSVLPGSAPRPRA